MDRLVAELHARIQHFIQSGDPSAVLDLAALEEAGRLLEAALPADGDLAAVPVDVLTALAYLHLARYQVLPEGQDQDDLQTAMTLFGALAARAPERVPDRVRVALAAARPQLAEGAERFAAEGVRAFDEYQRTGQPGVLDVAVTAFRDAAAATPCDHPGRPGRLSDLGNSLLARFERAGDKPDLDAAIDMCREAVAATAPDDPRVAGRLSVLANALLASFERAGDNTDLDAAIDAGARAVAATPPGHPNLASQLSNLGNFLRARFEHAGDKADLDAAIDAGAKAVAAAPPGHPGLPTMLSNLGNCLKNRFELTGDSADLNAAIDAGGRAVAAAPPGHPNRPGYLSNLGIFLRTRFEYSGDGADLDAAIHAGREAVGATPIGHPRLAGRLSNLGLSLRTRFGRTGNTSDLDAAIDVAQRAVDATHFGQPDLPLALADLGTALLSRFSRVGNTADLDAAIDAMQRAVASMPYGHPRLAPMLSNLGISLRIRYEHSGSGADLDAAIGAARKAVTVTPASHFKRTGHVSNLGNALLTRFERSGDMADLNTAIDAARTAVTATPPGHPDRAMMFSNLGTCLCRRFEHVGDEADLDAAIDAGRQALASVPSDHPSRPTILSNFGNFLRNRFARNGDPEDLRSAIDTMRQAVTATSSDHPDLAGYLSNLGNALLQRHEQNASEDLDEAISCWQQAAQIAAGRPNLRLAAATRWAFVAAGAARRGVAADGYAFAVGLLHEVAWHGLDRSTREEQLARWVGLSTDAAASAVLNGQPERAVELLEQGRSVLWAQALTLRSDLGRLAERSPQLAGRLDSIRKILDSPLPDATLLMSDPADSTTPGTSRAREQQDAVDLHRRKAREWDETLAQVRDLDGFEHFLTAVPYPELVAALDGPVVIVNASRLGCHALIVGEAYEQAGVVNLASLTMESVVDRAKTMLAALATFNDPTRIVADRDKARLDVLDVLQWLWEAVAEPLLNALGATSSPKADDLWPRVWWCPTGPFTVLPIHAAGYHPHRWTASIGGDDCVLDRVISSYTPTLTALTRSHQPQAPTRARHLAVGMARTPGMAPLPAVAAELDILARHFPPNECNHQLVESEATRADVLAATVDHSWVHLACHARQEHADPSRSGFALWDGTLTIADLSALPTQGRELAFLSACETATGSNRHPDEAIHVAAAMQFLGYKHVIATMWTIADAPAPDVSGTVYSALTQGGVPDPRWAAQALHHAVRALRQRYPHNPLLWAPYVHLGP